MEKRFKHVVIILVTICMMFGNVLLVYAATTSGTEKRPYNISEGNRVAQTLKKNSTTWYSITDQGQVNISINTNQTAYVEVYKKNLIGKTKLTSCSLKGSKKISFGYSSNVTYLIRVKVSQKTIIRMGYTLNLDSKKSAEGGYWKPNSNSPVALPGMVYLAKYYVPAKSVPTLYVIMGNDKYMNAVTKATTMTTDVAVLYLGNIVKIPEKYAKLATKAAQLKTVYDLVEPIPSFSLSEMYQKDISDKAGFNTSTGSVKNGVSISVFLYNGSKVYRVESWKDNVIKGVEGYKGKIYSFDK